MTCRISCVRKTILQVIRVVHINPKILKSQKFAYFQREMTIRLTTTTTRLCSPRPTSFAFVAPRPHPRIVFRFITRGTLRRGDADRVAPRPCHPPGVLHRFRGSLSNRRAERRPYRGALWTHRTFQWRRRRLLLLQTRTQEGRRVIETRLPGE